MSSLVIISIDGIKIILVIIRFSREINREGGENPPQPPLPYLGRDDLYIPLASSALGRWSSSMILKPEDLPCDVKYDLSEGEEMF